MGCAEPIRTARKQAGASQANLGRASPATSWRKAPHPPVFQVAHEPVPPQQRPALLADLLRKRGRRAGRRRRGRVHPSPQQAALCLRASPRCAGGTGRRWAGRGSKARPLAFDPGLRMGLRMGRAWSVACVVQTLCMWPHMACAFRPGVGPVNGTQAAPGHPPGRGRSARTRARWSTPSRAPWGLLSGGCPCGGRRGWEQARSLVETEDSRLGGLGRRGPAAAVPGCKAAAPKAQTSSSRARDGGPSREAPSPIAPAFAVAIKPPGAGGVGDSAGWGGYRRGWRLND